MSDIQLPLSAGAMLEFFARNWALMSIATTLFVLAAVPAYFLRKYVNIARNLMDEFAPPHWPESQNRARMEGDSVSFSAFDGHQLRGTMLRADPDVASRGVVIFAHEFGTDRWSCHPYAKPLRQVGYDVFAFDFRGHGESPHEDGYKPRQFPSDREQADMIGAIAYIEDELERQGRPREIGLMGLSRGAGAAIVASLDIPSVKAIAVDGGFSSDCVLEFHLKHWARVFAKLRFVYENHPPTFWRFLRWLIFCSAKRRFRCTYPSVRKALARLEETPLLIIHGERDSYIPLEQAQLLYASACGPKYLWTVPGARHNRSVAQQPEEYARRIIEFFDRHLAHRSPEAEHEAAVSSDLSQPLAPERAEKTSAAGQHIA